MTKKKRHHPDADEILSRPWCYYCERDFDDLKILIDHQKAKHFKCENCGRRLNTAGGLSVHMSQVHKENLTAVDNALQNRAGLDIEIFGMEGIPEDIVLQHNQRVLTQYHQAEAERRAATGNAAPGVQGKNPNKKPKTESISDLKKRLAEHKAAKLAAEQNGGGSSGSATPVGAGQSHTNAQQSPAQSSTPAYPQYQQPYAPPPSTVSFNQSPSYVPPQMPSGYSASGYPSAASPVYGQPPVQLPFHQPTYGQTPQPPFQQPPFPQPPFSTPQAFSPPPPFPNQAMYPGPPFPPQAAPNGHSPYLAPPVGVNRPHTAGTPPVPQLQQQRTHSPAQNGIPARPSSGSLPTAPGLPQRPAFGAPAVNAFQFQKMHQGQVAVPHTSHSQPVHNSSAGQYNGEGTALPSNVSQEAPNAASIDDLISSASREADAGAASGVDQTTKTTDVAQDLPIPSTSQETAKQVATEDKAVKKEKEKAKQTRLVYADNEVSPEEKMARMARYAFTPQQTVAV